MNFLVRDDRASIEYTLPSDGHFRLRLIKPITQALTISDLSEGQLSDAELFAALSKILEAHISAEVERVVFTDITPPSTTHPVDKDAITARFDRISNLMRRWARDSCRNLENAYLHTRLGQFSAVFELG